jgi:hypothetical protein
MKKSIAIIAAAVLSASIYSQNYDPANPHSTSNNAQLDSSSPTSSRVESSSPGQAEFDAQSSLRDQAEGDYNDGAAKQGLTLSDEEAAQVLRNTDDPDLANRNQEQGLTDPDRALNSLDTEEPDMIYEEWILITPEDVGRPGETESGSDRSFQQGRDVPNEPEMQQDDEFSDSFDRETGILNDERLDNSGQYSDDYVGAPANAQSGTLRSDHYDDDDCEVQKDKSLRSSGTATDHDERLNMERERESVGGPAESESGSSRSSEFDPTVPSSGSALDHDERYRINRSEKDDQYHINRDDSKVESSRSQELNTDEPSESRPIPPDL